MVTLFFFLKNDVNTLLCGMQRNDATTIFFEIPVDIGFVNSTQFLTIAIGDDAGAVTFENLQFTKSPFIQSTVEGKYSTVKTLENIYYDDSLGLSQSKVSIRFLTPIMQQLCGFNNSTVYQNAISGFFLGNNIFGLNLNDVGDDIAVEILNLPLDGYDFLSNQKSSLVAVIPVESLSKNGFGYSYIEPFPTFISCNNKEKMNVNNFTIAIKTGPNYLTLTDRIYMQLLLDE